MRLIKLSIVLLSVAALVVFGYNYYLKDSRKTNKADIIKVHQKENRAAIDSKSKNRKVEAAKVNVSIFKELSDYIKISPGEKAGLFVFDSVRFINSIKNLKLEYLIDYPYMYEKTYGGLIGFTSLNKEQEAAFGSDTANFSIIKTMGDAVSYLQELEEISKASNDFSVSKVDKDFLAYIIKTKDKNKKKSILVAVPRNDLIFAADSLKVFNSIFDLDGSGNKKWKSYFSASTISSSPFLYGTFQIHHHPESLAKEASKLTEKIPYFKKKKTKKEVEEKNIDSIVEIEAYETTQGFETLAKLIEPIIKPEAKRFHSISKFKNPTLVLDIFPRLYKEALNTLSEKKDLDRNKKVYSGVDEIFIELGPEMPFPIHAEIKGISKITASEIKKHLRKLDKTGVPGCYQYLVSNPFIAMFIDSPVIICLNSSKESSNLTAYSKNCPKENYSSIMYDRQGTFFFYLDYQNLDKIINNFQQMMDSKVKSATEKLKNISNLYMISKEPSELIIGISFKGESNEK